MLFDFLRSRSRKQICVIGLNASRRRRTAVVGVNRYEQIGLGLVGEVSTLLEGQITVARPCEHYFRSQPRLQQLAQTLRHVKHEIFFQQSLDRKSTRLNSSHLVISYAVFCLKKQKI